MSQEIVFHLLQDLGGDATINEINEAAKSEYPNRSVVSYTNKRLKSLEKKGAVEREDVDGETVWKVVDDNPSLSTTNLDQIDEEVSKDRLSNFGLSISNIVATLDLGTQLNLYEVARSLENASFEPESNSALIYRLPDDSPVTFMIPSSGRTTIVGAQNKEEVRSGINHLIKELEQAGYEVHTSPSNATIRNLVAVGDLGQEVDLPELMVYFGMEQTEYDPETFPGLVYRLGNHTTILYRSGKYIITGLGDYQSVLDAAEEFIRELPDEVATDAEHRSEI